MTVVEVPQPERTQPPVAAPDTISARTGDVVDIPVLANDEHPDALPLTLAPELDRGARAGGLLFASGDRLRYFAPERPGSSRRPTASRGPTASTPTATVSISVREADPETNIPPVPRDGHRARDRGRDGADPDPARRHRPRRRLRAAARPGVQPRTRRGRRRAAATGSSTRRASTRPAPTRSSTRSSTRSARARRAPSGSASPRASTVPARRSPSRTSSRCGPAARSRCGCSRTTPTPTAARLDLRSVKPTRRARPPRSSTTPSRSRCPTARASTASSTRSRTSARHRVDLPHHRCARRRAARPPRGIRHRADPQRHPRRGAHRRRRAPQRLPRRRRRRRPDVALVAGYDAGPRCAATAASA